MSASPRIGVVIPVYNGADDLRETLTAFRALPAQVLAHLEVVVADGASTDDTLNVMSTFMDVICHADSRDDLGVYDAMNRGAALVQAPYVWFMGAGDLPLEEGLSALLERLEETWDMRARSSPWRRESLAYPRNLCPNLALHSIGETPCITKAWLSPQLGSSNVPCPRNTKCCRTMPGCSIAEMRVSTSNAILSCRSLLSQAEDFRGISTPRCTGRSAA